MSEITFTQLAQLAERLQQTSKRQDLARMLANFLQALSPDEIAPSVRLIIGQVFPEWDPRALNLSWKAVMEVVDGLVDVPQGIRSQLAAEAVDGGEFVFMLLAHAHRQPTAPPLTILEVFGKFEKIAETAGKGSRARKQSLLMELFERASPVEAKYLAKITYQEMRHGVSEGIMLDAIARAGSVDIRMVRRANQLWGDLGEVATVALTAGTAGLEGAHIRLFRPLKPMLAQTAEDLSDAFESFKGKLALEYKLDGARVQIHRQGNQVRIYSRSLADVTESLPDIVARVRASSAVTDYILEGEVIAVDAEGRPLPFQHLMRRFRRKRAILAAIEEVPVELHVFEILYVNGEMLVDAPYQERWAILEASTGGLNRVPRLIPEGLAQARAFAEQAHRDGHEGVMAKGLVSAYTPGTRGKSWLKLKHVMSLDLVIIAADWGYGRRHGWLSNYHLAALDDETGEFQVVGKTFKGLTDAQFESLTEHLLMIERGRRGSTVSVQPKVVVEILFNEIQESKQYKSELALRFARVARLREDKDPSEANTLREVRALYDCQFRYKGRLS